MRCRAALVAPLLAALLASPIAAAAQDLPPGLKSARLLPAYPTAEGTWMTALRLELQPGWKTYWRSPGDSGVPPGFDWDGAGNIGAATLHWPVPEIIESAGERTLGYHGALVLPIEITPEAPGAPVTGRVGVELGLCESICVPAHLTLDAPPLADTPDPGIEAALAQVPQPQPALLDCRVTEIEDGLRVAVSAPATGGNEIAAALEHDGGEIRVSAPELSEAGGRITATSDFVAPSGKPFALDRGAVRLTLVDGTGGAVEYQGCGPA